MGLPFYTFSPPSQTHPQKEICFHQRSEHNGQHSLSPWPCASNETQVWLQGSACVKVDVSQTLNNLKWSFLLKTLAKMGFSSEWIELVQQCVCTSRGSVLINREPCNFFSPECGAIGRSSHRSSRWGYPIFYSERESLHLERCLIPRAILGFQSGRGKARWSTGYESCRGSRTFWYHYTMIVKLGSWGSLEFSSSGRQGRSNGIDNSSYSFIMCFPLPELSY